MDWDLEIRRAIRGSKHFLACLSKQSVNKRGYVQKELKVGLDVLDETPPGTIYLIPIRLEACEVPERLKPRQWVDLFKPGGLKKLLDALGFELGLLGPLLEPEMVLVPAGEFLMGSNPRRDRDAERCEQPQHSFYLPDYYIAKTPVTNAQYMHFVQAIFRQPEHWERGKPPQGEEDHPVVRVSWHDAVDYCKWLTETTGKAYRLPTEAEWEKAARGTDGRIYPWGDKAPDESRCNLSKGGTSPVGEHSPPGDSPYGCVDMAGNVWEWTLSAWGSEAGEVPHFAYPYEPTDGREDLEPEVNHLRVVRGGSFRWSRSLARCAKRDCFYPTDRTQEQGFRVVQLPDA